MAKDWRCIAESLVGSSHEAEGAPCQDSSVARVLGEGDASCLVACVADGAGSAKHSHSGSQFACKSVVEQATAYHEQHQGFDTLGEDEIMEWLRSARARIQLAADKAECSVRDFATTLLVVIVTPHRSYFFQIGDGAIVIGTRGLYGVVFWPQSGEYANTTNFLTGDNFEDQLESQVITRPIDEVALFSDGLERLALVFETQSPHTPFCQPLFSGLRAADDLKKLSGDLRSFLSSDSVSIRSDDDKSLVLATRGGAR